MKRYLIPIFLFLSSMANASTFVGNGGNVGDVERAASTRQVVGALKYMIDYVNNNVCSCNNRFETNKICDSLRELSKDQVRFCSKVIEEKANEVYSQIKSKDKVLFNWTHQPIIVRDGDLNRATDAVTDPSSKTITVNQTAFMNMAVADRVFLLTHESFHLVKWHGRYLTDRGELGPFKGKDGKRKLLNAISAATVVAADNAKLFDKYSTALKRPKAWKKNWIEADFGSSDWSGSSDNTYHNRSFGRFGVGFRRQLSGAVGLVVEAREETEERRLLSTIDLTETYSVVGAGITYRLFTNGDPLSFLGQSHFVGSALIEYLKATYQIYGPYTGLDMEDSSLGMSLGGRFYMPTALGVWVYVGLSAGYHSIGYQEVGLKYEPLRTSGVIGVSYGF